MKIEREIKIVEIEGLEPFEIEQTYVFTEIVKEEKRLVELCEAFLNPFREKELFAFLETYPYRLPFSINNWAGIIEYHKNYYTGWGQSSIPLSTTPLRCLEIFSWKKLDINKLRRSAIRQTWNLVDEELTSGDKLILRDIALKSFDEILMLAMNPKEKSKETYAWRIQFMHRYEPLINEVLNYGFRIDPTRKKENTRRVMGERK